MEIEENIANVRWSGIAIQQKNKTILYLLETQGARWTEKWRLTLRADLLKLLSDPSIGQLVSKKLQVRKWNFNKGNNYITYRFKDNRLEIVTFGNYKLLKKGFHQ